MYMNLPFYKWGGTVERGKPFVQIEETVISRRITYLGKEKSKFRNFQNGLPTYFYCFP